MFSFLLLQGSFRWTPTYLFPLEVPTVELDDEVTEEQDDASVEQQYPEIDNKTRKKKRTAEAFLRSFISENTSREDATVTIDTSVLAIPSFVQINEVALQRLPELIRVSQQKDISSTGGDFYEQWRVIRGNESEWARYLTLVTTLNVEDQENGIASFWNSHKKQFPHLANFARLVFGRPTSTGSVERLFSMLGNMCCRQRNQKKLQTCKSIKFIKNTL